MKCAYGPKSLPFIGSAHLFRGSTADIYDSAVKLLNSYTSPFRIWLGNFLYIVVSDADQLKTILLSQHAIEKDYIYKLFHPWVGTGIITASETTMDVDLKIQTEKNNRFIAASRRVLEIISSRAFKVWLYPDILFNWSPMGMEQRKLLQYLHGITDNIIQSKREALTSTKPINADDQDSRIEYNGGQKKALLNMLLELSKDGNKLTNEEVREEINTMIIAGTETTAITSTFVMFVLANFPEIQDKVYEELLSIYGPADPKTVPISYTDLPRMKYMECVIKETLRLFPTVPVMARQITQDLNIGEYTLPKGISVVMSIMTVHRDKKYWPKPLKFDPDRFLPENAAKQYPFSFIPFSGGPRNCLGMKYAMMLVKVIVATVLRTYVLKIEKFVPMEAMKLKVDISLKPAKPIKLKLARRNPEAEDKPSV
ncbi:hypothetical protein KM043_007938 [Ampulex compressa]|nr:hypothetical protein KM043_007938 [Ampulex compressa]